MAISERLALLVTLDAQGAIKSFNDLGKAADKNLGKADQKMDRMASRFQKAGAGMLATAGLAAAGLYKAGQAASDLGETVSQTNQIFGEGSARIASFAEGAASSLGQSERAAREAANTFGLFFTNAGKSRDEAAGMSIELAKLASDMASFKNTSPEQAVAALGAALRGESEPIRAYGVMLDDATLKQRALQMQLVSTTTGTLPPAIKMQAAYAEILEQTGTIQGDFERTSGGLANQQRILSAEFENLKSSLGQGVAPVLADVTGGLSGLVERFNDLSPAQQSVISKAALVGTALLGTAGALSFTVGKVIDARDRFSALADMTGGLRGRITGLSPAMKGLAGGFAIAGAAAIAFVEDQRAVSEGAKDLREEAEATGNSLESTFRKKISDAITENDNLRDSLDAAGFSFTEVADSLTGTEDAYASFIRNVLKSEAGVDANVAKLTRLREQYEEAGAQADEASTHVTSLSDATSGQAGAATDASGATAELTEAVDEQKAALDLATESMDKFKKGVEDAFGDLTIEEAADRRAQAFVDMAERFEDAQQGVKDARQRVADLLATPVEDRSDSFASDLKAAQKEVQDAINETSRALEGNSEAALQNREDIRGAVEDIAAVIQAHRDEGASMDALSMIREAEKANLEAQLEQLGFNREEIGRYIEAIDNIPITKDTTITVDTAPALLKIKGLAESLQALAPDRQLGIDAAIIDRNLQRASTRRAIGGPVTAGMGYSVNEYLGAGKGFEWFAPANGTVSTGAPTGTVVEQTNHFYNPVPEPASASANKLRRVALDLVG